MPQEFEKISHLFWSYWINIKTSGRFFQFLWSSYNVLTVSREIFISFCHLCDSFLLDFTKILLSFICEFCLQWFRRASCVLPEEIVKISSKKLARIVLVICHLPSKQKYVYRYYVKPMAESNNLEFPAWGYQKICFPFLY